MSAPLLCLTSVFFVNFVANTLRATQFRTAANLICYNISPAKSLVKKFQRLSSKFSKFRGKKQRASISLNYVTI